MAAPILVIADSVRRQRIAPIGREATACEFDVTEIAPWHLPTDDEPAVPKTRECRHEHSRA